MAGSLPTTTAVKPILLTLPTPTGSVCFLDLFNLGLSCAVACILPAAVLREHLCVPAILHHLQLNFYSYKRSILLSVSLLTCISGSSSSGSAASMTAAELKQRLEKKATFEAAVKELKAKLQDSSVPEPALVELLQLCSRVATLLKTRYANPAFFRAGSDLFRVAIVSSTV
jgi:hypothetical protein